MIAELAEGVTNVLQESVHQSLRKGDPAQVLKSNYPANPITDRKAPGNEACASACRYVIDWKPVPPLRAAVEERVPPGVCVIAEANRNRTGAPGSPERTPDFLWSLLALAHFMRLSLKKAAHAGVGGAPCRKSGYLGRK
jgi:hypothetical protein